MQTDTVVGIVGAVVLVSVMVGVFAYEYNNTGDEGDGDGGDQSTFEQDFPGLAADGDLDGDGTPNAEDDDVDGDGTLNPDDEETAVTVAVAGDVGASTGSPASDTQTLVLEEGATSLEMELTYQRPVGLPGQITQQPRLNFVLTDPNGETYEYDETLGGAGDASVTAVWGVFGSSLPAGEWTLTASANNVASPAMSYEGEAILGYGTA